MALGGDFNNVAQMNESFGEVNVRVVIHYWKRDGFDLAQKPRRFPYEETE